MILAKIRTANEEQLHQAIRELIANQHKYTLGAMHATTTTIYSRAKAIGASIERLNEIARGAT